MMSLTMTLFDYTTKPIIAKERLKKCCSCDCSFLYKSKIIHIKNIKSLILNELI